MYLKRKLTQALFLIILTLSFNLSHGYVNYSLDEPFPGLAGNSVVEIIYDGVNIWVGTGNGLSYSPNGGLNWLTFDHTNGLNQDGISALAYNFKDSTLWVGSSYSQLIEGVLIPFGAGFNKAQTYQDSIEWISFTPEQASRVGKLAYDVAVSDSAIWAACFYGGLIRSKDNGLAWENVFVDSAAKVDYDSGYYQDYRNRFFAVAVDVDTFNTDTTFIWGGTAAGIFKFAYTVSDSADTFDIPDTVFGFQQNDTIASSISGNFVVCLAVQKYGDKKIIWAGTQPTYNGFYAASYSLDGGATWLHTLTGDRVWNFDFEDSVVWAATSSGLKKSTDYGQTWEVKNFMRDEERPDQEILSPEFYAVRVVGDTIWAGNFDGLVMSPDGGVNWKVFRSFVPIGSPQAKTAYAYPNPFSPLIANQAVRIHYKPKTDGNVTIRIYDFEMKLVKTILKSVYRSAGVEYDQIWDGKNEKDEIVSNGIYFFRVEGPDGHEEWGKIGVIK